MLTSFDHFDCFVVVENPIEFERTSAGLGQKLACHHIVVFVVVDEKHSDFSISHSQIHFQAGSSTISNQYLPNAFITATNDSKLTGFVIKEFTPRS